MLHEHALEFLDRITGQRAATMDMVLGRWPTGAGIHLAQAGAGTLTMPGGGSVSLPERLPNGALRMAGGIFTAAMLLNEIQRAAERRQVEAAIRQFGLDRSSAVDVLAARAYVWGRNMAPLRFWDVPYSGPVNEAVAEAIMRHERDNPGTLGLATRGQRDAQRAIDALVGAVVGGATGIAVPQVFNRTSSVDPALSTSSARARTLIAIQGMNSWRAHHLIPFAVMAAQPVRFQMAVVASGWRMDSVENLIALPANFPTYVGPFNRTRLPIHNGPHPVYSGVAAGHLRPISGRARFPAGPALRTALLAIENTMKDYLALNRAPVVHPNLR